MSDLKISQLPPANTLTNAEEIPAVQSGSTVKIAIQTILNEIPQASPIADSTATDVAGIVADFNALLAELKASGLME